VGSHVSQLDPHLHDAAMAAVSHLPHLAAFALVNAVARQPQGALFLSLAGPGFRDFSRIAASAPSVWRDILLANRTEVLQQAALMRQALTELEAAMQDDDGSRLTALIDEASQTRSRWRLGGAPTDC
jgi:prephenate dehydrogenase